MEKPVDWVDLKPGDSIAVNGVCLTLEEFTSDSLRFALGPETLRVTAWRPAAGDSVNLERSLRFGDRVHGHLVSGHVDTVATIVAVEDRADTRDLAIEAPESFLPFVWKKGSVAVHGVSLTVNEVRGSVFHVGLIPETLKRTNLGKIRNGDRVHLEADAMARAWFHWGKKS